jgi:hypothetical protein
LDGLRERLGRRDRARQQSLYEERRRVEYEAALHWAAEREALVEEAGEENLPRRYQLTASESHEKHKELHRVGERQVIPLQQILAERAEGRERLIRERGGAEEIPRGDVAALEKYVAERRGIPVERLRERLPAEFGRQQRELHGDGYHREQARLQERPWLSPEHAEGFDRSLEAAESIQQTELDYARVARDSGGWRRGRDDPEPGQDRGPEGPDGPDDGAGGLGVPDPRPRGPNGPSGGAAEPPESEQSADRGGDMDDRGRRMDDPLEQAREDDDRLEEERQLEAYRQVEQARAEEERADEDLQPEEEARVERRQPALADRIFGREPDDDRDIDRDLF